MYGVGAAKWGKNFADITCRKGLKNIRKQIKTKKHLELTQPSQKSLIEN